MPSANTRPRQRLRPARRERRDEVLGALVGEPLERDEVGAGEVVQVGRVAHERALAAVARDARREHLLDARVAQPADVHRVARGEVHERLELRAGHEKLGQ
jgi:hypothetical protein